MLINYLTEKKFYAELNRLESRANRYGIQWENIRRTIRCLPNDASVSKRDLLYLREDRCYSKMIDAHNAVHHFLKTNTIDNIAQRGIAS
jgi:hypothetical protein